MNSCTPPSILVSLYHSSSHRHIHYAYSLFYVIDTVQLSPNHALPHPTASACSLISSRWFRVRDTIHVNWFRPSYNIGKIRLGSPALYVLYMQISGAIGFWRWGSASVCIRGKQMMVMAMRSRGDRVSRLLRWYFSDCKDKEGLVSETEGVAEGFRSIH